MPAEKKYTSKLKNKGLRIKKLLQQTQTRVDAFKLKLYNESLELAKLTTINN